MIGRMGRGIRAPGAREMRYKDQIRSIYLWMTS